MSEADLSVPEAAAATLWTFAVDLYARPGVGDACLTLQDRHGCDVNVLLFAAWMGAVRGHTLTARELAEAAQAVRDWHAEVVRPLRGVRRRLKSGPLPAPDAPSAALRNQLKSLEIEAERIELTTLEKLGLKWHADNGDQRDAASKANLASAVGHFARGKPLAQEAADLIRVIDGAIPARTPFAG